jgi:hypothetical protein
MVLKHRFWGISLRYFSPLHLHLVTLFFFHLASLAKEESDVQRAVVDHEMAEILRNKTTQLARTESRLRRQVETMWHRFHNGLHSIEQIDPRTTLALPSHPLGLLARLFLARLPAWGHP